MTANHAHAFQPHVVTAVRDNIAKHHGDLYYCTRDESAWSYGTMSLEDFHTIAHDDDVLDGLTESALEVLSGELAAAEQRGAEKALMDFKRFATRVMPSTVTRKDVITDIEVALKRLSQDRYLLMGSLRADQEGDDE